MVPRDEIAAAVEAAKAELDRRLPPDPYGSPVLAGTFERSQCMYDSAYMAYVHHGIGGESITLRFPPLADDEEIEADARRLMAKIRERLEARRERP